MSNWADFCSSVALAISQSAPTFVVSSLERLQTEIDCSKCAAELLFVTPHSELSKPKATGRTPRFSGTTGRAKLCDLGGQMQTCGCNCTTQSTAAGNRKAFRPGKIQRLALCIVAVSGWQTKQPRDSRSVLRNDMESSRESSLSLAHFLWRGCASGPQSSSAAPVGTFNTASVWSFWNTVLSTDVRKQAKSVGKS